MAKRSNQGILLFQTCLVVGRSELRGEFDRTGVVRRHWISDLSPVYVEGTANLVSVVIHKHNPFMITFLRCRWPTKGNLGGGAYKVLLIWILAKTSKQLSFSVHRKLAWKFFPQGKVLTALRWSLHITKWNGSCMQLKISCTCKDTSQASWKALERRGEGGCLKRNKAVS